jgi:OOP family OmpA-OmpF porin
MLRNGLFRALVALAIFCGAGQVYAGELYIAPAAMYTDGDTDRQVDDDYYGGQLSLGWAFSDRWSLEAMGAYSWLRGVEDLKISEASLNVLLSLSPNTNLSPYLLAGVGMMQTNPELGGNEESTLGNLGLGLKYRFGNSPISLRLEHRFRMEAANTLTYEDQITSLGLQIAFGRRSAPMPAPVVESDGDADGDGVPDSRDACPDTLAGRTVDDLGCARDGDRDGVVDDLDQCPNTVSGAAVDSVGCERDDDQDGIVNRLDNCPNTTAGVRVDNRGCEIREVIELPGVNFETNSDRLLPGAESVLSDAVATLRRNIDLVVEVAGHTDSAGSADYNASLSERRAITVRDYLVARGVNGGNLTARGYGEDMPIADNASADGRARNRRVELRILNEDTR